VLVGAARGIEAEVLPRYPFRHHLLPIEPIYRRTWWNNLRWPLIIGRAWGAVGRVLAAERPAIVIGTGGYAAGPVVWRAQRARIPSVLVEENAFPGLTTRWLARRARQVHLGFPEARERLRVGPATLVFALGNPIRPPHPGGTGTGRDAARAELGLVPSRPTLLVFGGSQGARALNYAVAGALERRLLDTLNVLWGTGTAHARDLARYAVPGRVVVSGFFDPITPAYRAADHQTENAKALAQAGAAIHVPEAQLTPYLLAEHVTGLLEDRTRLESLATRARARGHPDAARDVMSRILTLID